MKAVIMAAGEGRRLEPLTNVRPKPMLPAGNQPLLEHVVEAVAAAGIDDLVLVVGYKRERIQSYFEDGDDWDVSIEYTRQDRQLGTGHAVLQVEPVVDDDFLVLNGDRIIDPSAVEQVRETHERHGEFAMAVRPVGEPTLFGVVEVEGDHVSAIYEKPAVVDPPSSLINAGVYAFSPAVFDLIDDTETHGELALTAVLSRHLDDHPVRAVRYDGRWLDVTRPWDLVFVTGRLLDDWDHPTPDAVSIHPQATVSDATVLGQDVTVGAGAAVLRGSALGDNVRIGPTAVLENAILLPDVTVEAGAILRDCVVGANATIGANTTIAGGRNDIVLGDTLYRDVDFGGLVGDNARLGAATTLDPGTVLGNETTVEPGSHLTGRIEPHGTVRRG